MKISFYYKNNVLSIKMFVFIETNKVFTIRNLVLTIKTNVFTIANMVFLASNVNRCLVADLLILR